MQSKTPSAAQSHRDAGDGVQLSVTEARGGVRRGVIWVLVISTTLAVVGFGAVFLFSSHPPLKSTAPEPVAASTVAQANTLATPVWDRGHLGANGLEKCRAFRKVAQQTAALQRAGDGTISQGQSQRLQAQLEAAKALPPVALTPMECGVPL